MRVIIAIIAIGLTGVSQATQHDRWQQLLDRHVDWVQDGHASVVDYDGFQDNRDQLTNYLDRLSSVKRPEYENWSDQRQLAFLINAYNAFTVELILRHYPDIASIRDIGNFFSGPWDKDFFRLLGEKRTLDELEHEMIREWFDEPRIHFAVNCASVGCPALRPEAFTAEGLEQQLEDSTQRFLGDRQRNRVDLEAGKVYLSPIFKWYDEDFANGDVRAYLADHASLLADNEKQASALQKQKVKVRHTDYDWNLNSRENLE